jgi:hypothetical protein
VAEWSKAADCKSVSIYSRWFESNLSQLMIKYYPRQMATKQYFKKPNKPSSLSIHPATSEPIFKLNLNRSLNIVNYTIMGTTVQTTNFVLNFKRLRFFPLARPRYTGETIFTTSLGCISKFLNKGKSHTKKKSVFLLVASLLRKLLLYSNFSDMHLIVNRTPIYFQEILTQIHTPSKSLYKHPFVPKSTVDESSDKVQLFDFKYISFNRTKSYGYIKWKKKGRLKRKISKRVYSINRVID